MVANRLHRHLLEWCDSAKAVRLRGYAAKARKLRSYDRDWNLAASEARSPAPSRSPSPSRRPAKHPEVPFPSHPPHLKRK